MSHKSLSALIILAFILVCTPVWAQLDVTDKTFPLARDGEADEETLETDLEELEVWEPGISKGDFGVSAMFGFLDLNKTLMSHEQIIYKWVQTEVLWGDVEVIGANAFSPSVRAGYNFTQWFCLEALGGFSLGDYKTTAVNRGGRSNEAESAPYPFEPALGEFDTEQRSLLTLQAALNAVIYPFNISGDGKGRFHPYVSASVGRMWYSMNSNYSDELTGAMAYTAGGGIRFLVDKSISIRFEMIMNHNSVQFAPRDYFEEFNEGTQLVGIDEFPMVDGSLEVGKVEEYGSQTNTSMGWSVGVQMTF